MDIFIGLLGVRNQYINCLATGLCNIFAVTVRLVYFSNVFSGFLLKIIFHTFILILGFSLSFTKIP